jgi:hypothetical protein
VPQRISRKDLKRDQIREGFVHGAEAVASHQGQFWTYASIALLVIIAVLGWRYYAQRQTARAQSAFADAMRVYQARIRTPNEPPGFEELTYVDEKNRNADAEKKFADVAARYPRTRPGEVARYYDALCLAKLQKDAEAEKALKPLESSSDQGLAALARFQLAQLYDREGKGPQAVQIYQQLSDKSNLFVPRPVVLLALADHYSTSDPDQAAKYYQQVKNEYPDTPAAQTADQRLQLLPTKS